MPDSGQLSGEGVGESFDIQFHEQMRLWDENLRRILADHREIIVKLKEFVKFRVPKESPQQKFAQHIAETHARQARAKFFQAIPEQSTTLDISALQTNNGTEELLREADNFIHWPDELEKMILGLNKALSGNEITAEIKRELIETAREEIPQRISQMEAFFKKAEQAFDAAYKGEKEE